MNTHVIVALFACLAAANAGIVAPAATTVIAGPSAYTVHSGYVGAPLAYAGFGAPFAYAAPGPVAIVPPGSGLEGQYIPDNLEKLYDDGSYKPFLYP